MSFGVGISLIFVFFVVKFLHRLTWLFFIGLLVKTLGNKAGEKVQELKGGKRKDDNSDRKEK